MRREETEGKTGRQRAGALDLLHGRILPTLARLALPIMATAFVQMAYNLTDMAWIGFLGSSAVAAVGAAGMYTWLAQGVAMIAKMGGQVGLGQSVGAGKHREAAAFLRGALQLAIFLALLYGAVCLLFAPQLIGYFGLSDAATFDMAVLYLRIAGGLILFAFLNLTMTGLYTSVGDSRTPFLANCIGMFGNMLFDPVLIFGIGPFPRMGVAGAALATVSAQAVVSLVLFAFRKRSHASVLMKLNLFLPAPAFIYRSILRIGLPASVQSMVYTLISMVLTRIAATWGDTAVAVQRVGSQIESIAWMTADGFGSAVNAFMAQNYGARQLSRVRGTYKAAFLLMAGWGLFSMLLLYFGAGALTGLFLHEEEALREGVYYLQVISFGEIFMCVELMTVGALSGLGRTGICSAVSMTLTGSRIPIAYALSATTLGIGGVWWAFSLSSMAKGVIFTIVFLLVLRQVERKEVPCGN